MRDEFLEGEFSGGSFAAAAAAAVAAAAAAAAEKKKKDQFDPRIRVQNSGVQNSFPRSRAQIRVSEVQNPLCRNLSLTKFQNSQYA